MVNFLCSCFVMYSFCTVKVPFLVHSVKVLTTALSHSVTPGWRYRRVSSPRTPPELFLTWAVPPNNSPGTSGVPSLALSLQECHKWNLLHLASWAVEGHPCEWTGRSLCERPVHGFIHSAVQGPWVVFTSLTYNKATMNTLRRLLCDKGFPSPWVTARDKIAESFSLP
jgi:hypothetical protein